MGKEECVTMEFSGENEELLVQPSGYPGGAVSGGWLGGGQRDEMGSSVDGVGGSSSHPKSMTSTPPAR